MRQPGLSSTISLLRSLALAGWQKKGERRGPHTKKERARLKHYYFFALVVSTSWLADGKAS
jgi:hypothetical protein